MAVNPTSGKVRCLEEFEVFGGRSIDTFAYLLLFFFYYDDVLAEFIVDCNVGVFSVFCVSLRYFVVSEDRSTEGLDLTWVDGGRVSDNFEK
jgi:hypothetical protein